MTASARKKKEKKKDFQKAKLKVGKAKPKASNYTDTSFKSKAIVLAEQSLKLDAPSSTSQFDHHMSLLSARSDSQRKESLSYLTTAVSSRLVGSPLPQPLGTLLPKLLPKILDGSNGVRTQLLKLLQALPHEDMPSYAEQILLYIRTGMTHLAVDIRRSSLDLFDWAIKVCGTDLVECPGGWIKTLTTFLTMLGWSVNNVSTSAWSTKAVPVNNDKITARILSTLAAFLELGLMEKEAEGPSEADLARAYWPLHHTWLHMIPKKSNPYRYLNLYGPPKDEENESYDDVEARQEAFKKHQQAFQRGLNNTKKVGGEIGRASAKSAKAINEGMKDVSGDD